MDSPTSALRPYSPKDITGISLLVNEYEEEQAHVLTYHKSDTSVIDIGRKSSRPKGRNGTGVAFALFKCPVISRRHAKITFTDLGNAQIVDLSSHHGTHILQAGDTVATALLPDMPRTLSDGDIITFGKTVGRDDCLVRPVTVRVSLIFGASVPHNTSSPPAIVRSISTNSGRYGVYAHSSSSSSSRSSSPALSENGDSDVEEIPRPPTIFPVKSFGCAPSSLPFPGVNRSGRFGLLRRILPPIHNSEVTRSSPQGDVPHSPISVSSTSPSPDIVEIVPEPSVVGAWPDSALSSRQPSPEIDVCTASVPQAVSTQSQDFPSGSIDGETSPGEQTIRLPSPVSDYLELDLLSYPPLPPQTNIGDHEAIVALADSVSEDLVPDARSDRAESGSHYDFVGGAAPPSDTQDSMECSTPIWQPSCRIPIWRSSSMTPAWDEFEESPVRSGANSPVVPDAPVTRDEPVLRGPSTDLFDARLWILKSRLADLEKQLMEQRHDNSHSATTVVNAIQVQEHVSQNNEATEAPLQMREEASAAVLNLKEMVAAMEDLRTKSETDIAQELEAIRAARAEAVAAAAEATAHATTLASLHAQVHAPQIETSTSLVLQSEATHEIEAPTSISAPTATLKRKRDEVDDDLDIDRRSSSRVLAADPTPTGMIDGAGGVSAEGGSCCGDSNPAARPVKRRRATRIIEGVAKTTAIAAVGAVAAWSALAFS